MPPILILFLAVFVLNLIPAFAPPTWMVFSLVGFRFPTHNLLLYALVGAAAATLGRVVLAAASRRLLRQGLLDASIRENVDALGKYLEQRRTLTFNAFLFYAFTPLPSNYLFMSFGLTAMNIAVIAVPFFLGRCISYSFWGLSSAAVARWISADSSDALGYFSVYYVVTQLLLLAAVYVFTRIDWRALLAEKTLRWLKGSK